MIIIMIIIIVIKMLLVEHTIIQANDLIKQMNIEGKFHRYYHYHYHYQNLS